MDSPERNLTISAAEVQGSPLFNFLCSLSPIKPVKSVHVAQTFSEISFPPPPAVFVSPRVDAQKDSSSLQRNQSQRKVEAVQTGSGTSQVNAETEGKRAFPNSAQSVQRIGGARKNDNAQKDQSLASPCSSPSKLVEEYLAEPVEDALDMEGSSRMLQNLSTCEAKGNSIESGYKDVEGVDNLVGCSFSAKQEVVDSTAMLKLSQGGGSDEGETGLMEKRRCNFQDTQGMDRSSTLHLTSQRSGNDKNVLDFDQEASEFEFLMSEEADKLHPHACLDDWHGQGSSSLFELSVEQVEGYIASLREVVNKEEQETAVGLSSGLATNSVQDKSPMIDNLEAEPEVKGDQQGAAACRANVPLQRGVRRRCLDFEVSEGHVKGKSGILSLRPMHTNSSTGSQDVSSCGVESNMSLLVLRERASATSGATNSESMQESDASTQVCPREDGTASTKVTCAHSSNLRLSCCSSLKDTEFTAAKFDSQLASATTRHSGTSPVPAGMPSGIGLHLNSLTGSMAFIQTREIDGSGGSSASLKSANAFPRVIPSSRLQGSPAKKTQHCFPLRNTGKHSYAGSTAGFRQGLGVSHVEKTRMDDSEVQSGFSDQVINSSKSTSVQSVTLGIKQVEESVPSNGVEKRPSPLGRKRVLLPDLPRQRYLEEESNQSPHSPKKKRRSSSTAEKTGDGCKRCNCKKSKCLKLYCECFAAGVYCVDSCSCHDCFNKPESEEMVMETRQQIESRNPLAFAPKIIRAAESSPNRQEDRRDTPASARHKRGCNCKKSHCLKKYCECYQAGVGCSDGCRCESCKNAYGRKEGAEDSEAKDLQVEAVDKETAEEHIDTSDFCNELAHGSQQQNNDLSPITPSFRYAGQNRIITKARSASKRRFSSEELHSPTFLLSSVKLSRSPSRLLRSCKGAQNSPPGASMGMQPPKVGSSPISTPRILRIGQFSPRWDGLGDICTLTPLPQAPPRPTPASASVRDGPDSSPSINRQHCNKLSSSGTGSVRNSSKFTRLTSPMSQHQSSQSSVLCQIPANMQGTPATPVFASPACAMDDKSCYEESEAFGHQFVGSVEDDGTPEFLKDPELGCSPVCLLNSSSPKHKRVSPPHHHASREALHRGLQSPCMRSGRKFILQSIPSVPPTPFPAVHEQPNGSRNYKAET